MWEHEGRRGIDGVAIADYDREAYEESVATFDLPLDHVLEVIWTRGDNYYVYARAHLPGRYPLARLVRLRGRAGLEKAGYGY